MRTYAFFIFLAACVTWSIACNQNTATNTAVANTTNRAANAPSVNTQPTAPADYLAASRELYKVNCAKCHKEDGTGGKVTIDGKELKAENLTADKFKNRPDEKLIEYITNGVPDEGMPAFKDKLKEDEIKQIVMYIRKGLQKM